MNTTAEIMELAHEYADAASEEVYEDLYVETTRRALRNAVNELVEQAKWAHHTPALLSEADAAADIAGVARPGAEPVAAQQRFRHPQKTMPGWSPWQLCKPATRPAWEVDSEGYEVEYRALYTAPPQASQPEARPGAEPVAYLYHDATTPQDAHPWLHSTMLVLAADRRQGLRGETPLYTAPPQASQPVTRPGAEPVAWGWRRADGLILEVICPDEHEAHEGYYTVPLYTTPQASQPLTDGELLFHYNTAGGLISSLRAVQEAILSVNGAAQKGKP